MKFWAPQPVKFWAPQPVKFWAPQPKHFSGRQPPNFEFLLANNRPRYSRGQAFRSSPSSAFICFACIIMYERSNNCTNSRQFQRLSYSSNLLFSYLLEANAFWSFVSLWCVHLGKHVRVSLAIVIAEFNSHSLTTCLHFLGWILSSDLQLFVFISNHFSWHAYLNNFSVFSHWRNNSEPCLRG